MTEKSDQDTHEIVRLAVIETLLQLGVDASSPESVIEIQKDFQHLRRWREAVDSAQGKSIVVVAGTLATGAIAALAVGIKSMLGGE